MVGGLRLEHDDQVTDGVCARCGAPYESVIGVLYEDEEAIAIYRADLFDHFHRDAEPRVVLSIAVGELDVVGWQLTSKEAEASPLREAFLRLADHVACNDRRLRRVLATRSSAPPL